jgi:membrane protein YdbS with pleckstrin-like domain
MGHSDLVPGHPPHTMPTARYFLPDQPTMQDVYSKDELRLFMQKGMLRRGDIVMDDETGHAHLLGDLLSRPQQPPRENGMGGESENERQPIPQDKQVSKRADYKEFRADTPLPVTELEAGIGEEEYEYHESTGDESSEDEPLDKESSEEELVLHLRPSWFSYPRSVLLAILCGAVAYYCATQHIGQLYVIAASSVSLLCLLAVSLFRSTTDYYITTERVETEYGLIGRNSNEVRIRDIRAIDVRMNGLTALIGVGTVDFSSAGGAAVEVQFKNVRNPHRVKRMVRELQG